MASKIKPCTGGKRHSWKFLRNVTVGRQSIVLGGASSASFSRKGLYQCTACQAKKHGAYDINEALQNG